MSNTLIICITLVILSVVFILFYFLSQQISNTYTEEIVDTCMWRRPSGGVYRKDYTIERTYKDGTVKIYIKHIHT